MGRKLSVTVENYMMPETPGKIAAAFGRDGFDAEVRASASAAAPPGTGELTTLTLIAIPASAFLTTLAAEFAKDAYKKLKELIADIHRDRAIKPGVVWIEDDRHGFGLALDTGVPEEAYARLFEIDLDDQLDVFMSWDDKRREWVTRARKRSYSFNSRDRTRLDTTTLRLPLGWSEEQKTVALRAALEQGWRETGRDEGRSAEYVELERIVKIDPSAAQ